MAQASEALVFFVGEGPADIGDYVHLKQYRSAPVVEGYLPTVVRRLAGRSFQADGRKLALLGKSRIGTPADALGKKARVALELAGQLGACTLVFCHDVDREPGASRSTREVFQRTQALRAAIAAGFAAAIAETPALAEIHRVVALPVRIIEAWALADPSALGSHAVDPRRSPEALWGDEADPRSSHPKRVLARALGRAADTVALRDLAERCDLDAVAQAAPSFARLRDEVAAVVKACRQ